MSIDSIAQKVQSGKRRMLLGLLVSLSIGSTCDDARDPKPGARMLATCEAPDCEADAGPAQDAAQTLGVPPPPGDAGLPQATSGCSSDQDCDDRAFCNGVERCKFASDGDDAGRSGSCVAAAASPCGPGVVCFEPLRRCDCDLDKDGRLAPSCGGDDSDADGDKQDSVASGGLDCDDSNAAIFWGAAERCDLDGVDEDCDQTTYAGKLRTDDHLDYDENADKDNDGHVDQRCRNVDPMTLRVESHGDDCDDRDPAINPDAEEVCDDVDNNCNHLVDESRGSTVNGGLKRVFYRDLDGDEWADLRDQLSSCVQPPGYIEVPADARSDCDDTRADVHPTAKEKCDGRDNDCDQKIDAADQDDNPLVQEYTFPQTTLACQNGEWIIVTCPAGRAWCATPVERGCATDATQLESCNACETQCSFACAPSGCDELRKLSVGVEHTCAITSQGRAACWGRGERGRLGDDSIASSAAPQLVIGLDMTTDIAAGTKHTCAIAGANHAVYCWGDNSFGQLGSSDTDTFSAVPLAVLGVDGTDHLTGAKQIAAGEQHSCALLDMGRVACWGQTGAGLLGDGASGDGAGIGFPRYAVRQAYIPQLKALAPLEIANAQAIAIGKRHSCILTTEGTVECWGDDTYGQLGDSKSVTLSNSSQVVPTLSGVSQIAAGAYHTCAISAGQVECWGLNGQGQLGRPSDDRDAAPVAVPGVEHAAAIASGDAISCATTAAGKLLCWGYRGDGALGEPVTQDNGPATMIALDGVIDVAAGDHVCALTRADRAWCWGDDFFGQLGDGESASDPRTQPTLVHPLLVSGR